ncbi:hydroxyacid dehydrogenase [Propioniciclava coleopterorum]|uniref:Hydroxyacid dehydrogenase n=1 Tax=Propioniciclava coleopterorum TaxID=2714937 RepID=A0A6G7Y5F0_9ACTN|nr:hydroxyacid dehydrogenase [Propioniciclava coleopterorum]QIK71939.1 hydroxyacid dehydrogenase [Propioniciclava coleopterorum]
MTTTSASEPASTAATRRPGALLVMNEASYRAALSPESLARLGESVDLLVPGPLTDVAALPDDVLARTEVLITGWGAAPITPNADRLPALRALVHTAGTVKHLVTPDMMRAGLAVSTATAVNARPVAEFATAAIIFALKRVPAARANFLQTRDKRGAGYQAGIGAHGGTVGLIGASRVARAMKPWLDLLEIRVVVSDPYLDPADAAALGWELVDLDTLLRRSDVVSLHAPSTPETAGMLGAAQFASMKDGATFINTARGALIDHDALAAEAAAGRLDAMLDVTDPEPLPADHPLWELPNVWITPHIAGSIGDEVLRLGASAVDEVERFVAGEPFERPVEVETWALIG